jgi:hypothetical protein
MWIINDKNAFNLSDRPDLSGVLITLNNPDSDWVRYSHLPSFTAYETREGSFKGYWAQKLLKKLSKKWLIILMPWSARLNKYKVTEGTQFIGPAKALTLVMNFNRLEAIRHGNR